MQAQWPEYKFATETMAKNHLETVTNCKGARKGNVGTAITGPCGASKPEESRGQHIVYLHQGSKLGTIFSCSCCKDTVNGPLLKKLFSVDNWEKSCR